MESGKKKRCFWANMMPIKKLQEIISQAGNFPDYRKEETTIEIMDTSGNTHTGKFCDIKSDPNNLSISLSEKKSDTHEVRTFYGKDIQAICISYPI